MGKSESFIRAALSTFLINITVTCGKLLLILSGAFSQYYQEEEEVRR